MSLDVLKSRMRIRVFRRTTLSPSIPSPLYYNTYTRDYKYYGIPLSIVALSLSPVTCIIHVPHQNAFVKNHVPRRRLRSNRFPGRKSSAISVSRNRWSWTLWWTLLSYTHSHLSGPSNPTDSRDTHVSPISRKNDKKKTLSLLTRFMSN